MHERSAFSQRVASRGNAFGDNESQAEYAAFLRADASLVAMLPCLADADLVVGRGTDVSIQIHDAYLSRQHARLAWDARYGTHVLTDLGSANGTRLNGRRVRVPVRLEDGAAVQFGKTTVHYRRWSALAFQQAQVAHEVDATASTRRIELG